MKRYVIYSDFNDCYLDKKGLGFYECNRCCYLIKSQDLEARSKDLYIFPSKEEAQKELDKIKTEHFFSDGIVKEFNKIEELWK